MTGLALPFAFDEMTQAFVMIYIPILIVLIAIAMRAGPAASPAATKSSTENKPSAAGARSGSLSARGVALGNNLADRFAALPLTPNQVSVVGLTLGFLNCLLYLYHQNGYWLGFGLAVAYPFDSLDGLLARRQGRVTKFGGYLDAVVDRYQEIISCFAIGLVTGWWVVIFFVLSGAILVSYNKARLAIEMPTPNKGWPDLLIQHRRLWIMCFGLIADTCAPGILFYVLIVLAVMSHFTALQRFFRARRMLWQYDRAQRS